MKKAKKVIMRGEMPKIEVSKIPSLDVDHVARATLHAIRRYFELPGVKEDYEAWLKDYNERKAAECK